ncbi:exo-alpha-sialidase [Planctomycetota bacterium]|nr:exo-alpha-sialidase [Planctomycetota bacterium]
MIKVGILSVFKLSVCFILTVLLTFCCVSEAAEISWENNHWDSPAAKGFVVLRNGDILATETIERDGKYVIVCWQSIDHGKNWSELSIIKSADLDVDLGDGHLIELKNGQLLFSYRYNHYRNRDDKKRSYQIKVSASSDDGLTWSDHSIVSKSIAAKGEGSKGLWASFLFEDSKGEIFCFFDNEEWPNRSGFKGHQWVIVKRLNQRQRTWAHAQIVGRASLKNQLSRDGMPSVVAWENGEMLAVFESVNPVPPHENIINATRSNNYGRTWNWRKHREQIYHANVSGHLSLAPWAIRIGDDRVICVFATDEDRPKPSVSGTAPDQMQLALKYIISFNRGRTWSRSRLLYDEGYIYKPGVGIFNHNNSDKDNLLVMFLDYKYRKFQSIRGEIILEDVRSE